MKRDAAALVTGVSTGIGAATLRELLDAGYRVFGTVRRARDAAAVEAAGATPIIMDVTMRSSVVRARETLERALGGMPLEALVCNAGVPGVGPLEHMELEDIRHTFDVNVIGTMSVIQLFLPRLRQSAGRIVIIGSVSGRLALPFSSSYAASKFALEGLADTLRRELANTGVRVVLLEPGSVKTAIWEKIEAANMDAVKGTVYERALGKMRTLARQSAAAGLAPEVVGRAVLRAVSEEVPPARILVVGRGDWRHRLLRFLPDRLVDRLVIRRVFGT